MEVFSRLTAPSMCPLLYSDFLRESTMSRSFWARISSTTTSAVTVTAEVVVELILAQKDLLIIDSRKKSEYSKGHIEGAVNLLNTSMQREALEALCPNKTTPIVFYCNGIHCLRSSDAIHKAMECGYTNIFWFRGGWKEWTDKRLPAIAE